MYHYETIDLPPGLGATAMEAESSSYQGFSVTIIWSPNQGYERVSPSDYQSKGGVYIIADKNKNPIYVGQTQEFETRRNTEANVIGRFGISADKYTVWFGRFSNQSHNTDDKRRAVEHALIRLLKLFGHALNNKKSINPFFIQEPGETLIINPPLPSDLRSTLIKSIAKTNVTKANYTNTMKENIVSALESVTKGKPLALKAGMAFELPDFM